MKVDLDVLGYLFLSAVISSFSFSFRIESYLQYLDLSLASLNSFLSLQQTLAISPIELII